MRSARRLVLALLPPALTSLLRAVRGRRSGASPAELRYTGLDWPQSPGWDHPSVAARQRAEWDGFVAQAEAPRPVAIASGDDGRSTVGDIARHNTLMCFAYVLGVTARQRDRISVLDWGCGLGQYAVLARSLFPDVDLDYHCRELPLLVNAGRSVLPGDTFHDDDLTPLSRTYDLVVASGSIQYRRDWQSLLTHLANVATGFVYVTRLPVVDLAKSFVVVQRPKERYETEYPGWILNRSEFLETAVAAGLTLVREFLIWERISVPSAPEEADSRGFLFAAPGVHR